MSSMVPQGIASLSAYLKQNGIQTAVFDTTFYPTERDENLNKERIGQVEKLDDTSNRIEEKNGDVLVDLRNAVTEFKPDLIAVSMVEDVFYQGISLLKSIQDLKVPNVVGGVFPTFAPDKVISQDCVDMLCIGEGEEAILELCNALSDNQTLHGILGIWSKNEKGDIIKTQVRKPVSMVELPTPDYDVFSEELLYRPMQGKVRLTLGIETQRGCPFACAFCNSPAQKNLYSDTGKSFYRRKPVESVKRDLELLAKKYKPDFIYWVADTFLAMPEREWDEFYEMYMDFRIPFWMNTRPETITRKRVEQLEIMNCMRCNIGIEHGNYRYRKDVIFRKTKDSEILEGFKAFEGTSITVVANTIIGYPGETEELIRESLTFNRKLAPYIDSITANIFAPYHGTVLREKAVNEGYISDDLIVETGTTTESLLKSPYLSNDTLKGLLRTFPLYVKLPESYYSDIRRCEKLDDKGNALHKELLGIYQEKFINKKRGNDWEDLH
jgi:radical SAM superfamily enzyme YgiQ (UPF0313 family)